MKRGWIAGLLAVFFLGAAAPRSAHALTISDDFGFSAFNALIDEANNTITLTETIDSLSAGFTMTFDTDDLLVPWFVTKNVTNDTGSLWINFDNELKVPYLDGFISSNDFDGVSFNQPNVPPRVITSTNFEGLLIDEVNDRDFIQFGAPGSVTDGETDVQEFPIISFSIRQVQLVQTPNFQNPDRIPIPEPSSMLLFGLGGLGAGVIRRRRKLNKV